MAALESDCADTELAEDLRAGLHNLLTDGPDMRGQAGALFGDLRRVAEVTDEEGAVLCQHQMAAVAAETGQVGDIDRIGDEQRVQCLVHQDLSIPATP